MTLKWPTPGLKRIVIGSVGFCISGLLLWLAFRRVDLAVSFHLIRRIDLLPIFFCVVFLVFAQLVRTYRFGVLIRPIARVPLATLLLVANLGSALILLLPFRLGDLARPYLLKKEAGVAMSAGIGAAVVERVMDGVVITLIFFVSMIAQRVEIEDYLLQSSFFVGVVFGALMIGIILFWHFRVLILDMVESKTRFLPARASRILIGILNGFSDGLASVPNPGSFVRILASTVVYFSCSAMSVYAVMVAFDMDLPVSAAFLLMCIIILGTMIPAGPSYLGTFQAAVAVGLAVFAVDADEAAAFGLVLYPLTILVVVGFGFCFLPWARALRLDPPSSDGPATGLDSTIVDNR